MNDDEVMYVDHDEKPPWEFLEPSQVWVWMAGATPPHWEIRGTGVILSPDEQAKYERLKNGL